MESRGYRIFPGQEWPYGSDRPSFRVERPHMADPDGYDSWVPLWQGDSEADGLEALKSLYSRLKEDGFTPWLFLSQYETRLDDEGDEWVNTTSRMVIAQLPPPAPDPDDGPEP